MSLKINLLKKEKKGPLIDKKVKKSFSFFSLSLFLILLISFASVYIYWSVLSRRTEDLDQQINAYNKQIESYKEVEQKKSILNAKLFQIKNIYDQRKDFVKGIEELENILPEGINMQNLALDKQGLTDIKAVASSSAEIEKFVDNLKLLKDQGLTKASLVSLDREKDGSYAISLKLEIPKKEP